MVAEPAAGPGRDGSPRSHRPDQFRSSRRKVYETPLKYWITLACTGSIVLLLGAMLTYLVNTGIGVWGNNKPVGWAWDITNFVFWIGIGHAGTLISAILFLFRQKWRTSINRSAEAMTLFAVMCAGIFPLFHTGRPVARVLLAVPDPQHRSESCGRTSAAR